MSAGAIYVLVVAGIALVLFVTERVSPDLIALLVLISLGVGGLLDLPTLFSGFSNPAMVTLIGLFMLTAALQQTGVTAYVSLFVLRLTHGLRQWALVGVLTLSAALASLMMNTVAAAALIVPVGRRVALNRDISPSRLLMPISFGAVLGGMATLLTTSNLLIAGLLAEHGLPTFGLLDFLPVGGPIALAGLIYLAIFSPRLLPERSPSDQWSGLQLARRELTHTYRLAMRLHEAYVPPSSSLVGKTLAESDLGRRYGVTVSAVVHGRDTYAPPSPHTRLQAGDWLLLQGRPDDTEAAARDLGLTLLAYDESAQAVLFASNSELAEVALSPRSTLVGHTLEDIRFREKYGLNVLAIWHESRPIRSHLTEYALERGDALLVQGSPERIHILTQDPDFLVLTRLPEIPEHTERAVIAVIVLALFLLAVALNVLPISLAALLAGVTVVLTRCITAERARASIQWQVLFLIAGMLPLAKALEQTGAMAALLVAVKDLAEGIGPRGLLMIFYLIAAALAQSASGQAAALIAGPLAIAAAQQFGLNPQALAMGVALGASTAFLSPVSHPANLLVMGPGGYRFGDYAKLGFGLVLITALGVYVLTPLVYPL